MNTQTTRDNGNYIQILLYSIIPPSQSGGSSWADPYIDMEIWKTVLHDGRESSCASGTETRKPYKTNPNRGSKSKAPNPREILEARKPSLRNLNPGATVHT